MKIDNEILSAFLDAELSEQAMEEVRCALETDDDLVMRLADLSQVDHWVGENAAIIDRTAIPDGLLLLAQSLDKHIAENKENQAPEKVVSLSRWKNVNQSIKKHYALAAGISMIFGVGTITLMQSAQSTAITAGISQVLNQAKSGEISTTDQGDKVTANLSFTNHAGNYCRQFQHINTQAASINIACKENHQWQLKITKNIAFSENMESYRVASNKAQLDSAIDEMIKGQAMDSAQEQRAIINNWQTNKK
ncbi:hypothetical protein [Colwellia hornerae]|uniref:Anti-sigma factor n=1 Tax=Colwellia hornerae TaxID=89402 RepID=A0A5C6QFY4_9GAMM|nr:hypothetical protein [Colwellia hornerae]TWX52256.1 hypothetical protein ESZ28_12645 [Colwellia hornerae]TWX57815.1 hypothetical protein ESZ26_12610 [Colwellia hornerae]TWX67517.1 hypothetical protein ESZ27_08480 [Colwellia hornerae]